MTEFQAFYESSPLWASIVMLMLGGWAIAMLAIATMLSDLACDLWRQSRAGRPEPTNPQPWEYSMKKRILFVALLAVAVVGLSLTTGCKYLDGLGFGVDIALVSEDGREFAINQTPDGIDIQGEFIEPHTGIVFVLGEGIGNIIARDPSTGLQVTIKPKDPPDSGADPEVKAALRHVHEAVG